MSAETIQVVRGIGVAFLSAAAGACWVLCVVAKFKSVANRKPGVGSSFALNWLNRKILDRRTSLDDVFTDLGKWWAKADVLAMLGFLLSVAAVWALG